jgi:uncharacterized protein (DUF1330 family)
MAAYVIVEIEITDPERYAEYIRVAPPTIERFAGRYLVRGGKTEALEGTWQPKRVVVLEFDTVQRAKEWWGSAEYAGPKRLRQAAAVTNMIVVEGVG